jgi:hypothetical protein
MVTKAQIDPIAIRIEAPAPKSNRFVGVWRNRDETAEEVLERHYLASPSHHPSPQAPRSAMVDWRGFRARNFLPVAVSGGSGMPRPAYSDGCLI